MVAASDAPGEPVRLQVILAQAGLGSRRACEELIEQGRVEVDGRVLTTLGTKVGAEAKIVVDGSPIRLPKRFLYLMVNKPGGVVTTTQDQAGRASVLDLLPPGQRLFPVGRLDMQSEGLLLVTNDGELANRLTHPRYGVPKIYSVEVAGQPTTETLQQVQQGMYLAEGFAKAEKIALKRLFKQSALLELVLDEGKNREVRRLLAKVGHKVLKLKRIALGPLRLGELPPGQFRPLTGQELEKLQEVVSGKPTRKRRPPKRASTGSRMRQIEQANPGAPSERPSRPRPAAGGSRRSGVAAPVGGRGRAAPPPRGRKGVRNTRLGGTTGPVEARPSRDGGRGGRGGRAVPGPAAARPPAGRPAAGAGRAGRGPSAGRAAPRPGRRPEGAAPKRGPGPRTRRPQR